ncbi:Enhancer of polycomb-like transcription factor protein [Zea mays]|uniref:Enhancer of polycomb-like protein n=1 Tax=Zea mays TaxID=4577 RepID=A0A1D6MJG5_MAIZE|nr:Enhancer of polycomb-like transcription factor protein [Zea mays]ONM29443.1 Enhancer of polycomb-like transcription factor protein [Zea mays]
MEPSGSDKPTATDANESVVGLDGEDTLSERESVGAKDGPALPNGSGKEAHASSPSAANKRKHNDLGSNQMELNEPGTPSSSSGDSTWSINGLDDCHQLSLSRNKNDDSEHSVTSAGVTVIRQPRGVLRLRKLAQNVSTESWTGGHNTSQANGVPRSSQHPRRNNKRESIPSQENRVSGDEPVSCLRTENGTCDQDTGTKFCSKTEFLAEKQSHLSGEPPKAVHVDKGVYDYVKDDDGDSLEENAAWMLCSLSDNKCAGSPRKGTDRLSKRSFSQNSNHFKNSYEKIKDICSPARLLRKRDGKVPFLKRRQRRHFYEVSPSDVDPFCIVKERIRVFWPLDETWYFGMVKEYNPVTRLHHVRYDGKDEEWINLQNERIKLLFLPAEAPNKSKCTNSRSAFESKHEQGDREDMHRSGSNTESFESGPISSWLARSNQAKSAALCDINKQDHSHSNTVPVSFDQKQCRASDAKESIDSAPCSSLANGGVEVLKDRTIPEDGRFHFVYSRKRFCRKKNDFLSISEQHSNCQRRASSMVLASCPDMKSSIATGASVTYVIPALSLPLKPVYKLLCEACCVSVSNAFFLLQCGTMVALWPVVHLDILLIDSALGLKRFLLDTCMRSAVSLFCLLAGSFKQCSRQRTTKESRIPCTSVRFQISGGHGRSQVVFMFFSFVGVEKWKWEHLQGKLQYQCSKRELSKDSTKCTGRRALPSMGLFSKGFDVQESVFLPESNYSDIKPAICCLDDRCKFTQSFLDMTTAPSVLLWHHRKMLMESNSTNGSQQSMSCALDEDHQQLVTEHASDTVCHAPLQVCSLNLGSSPYSPLDMVSASCANPSSSTSREPKITERNISPECNDNSIDDANIIDIKFRDQNEPCIGADRPCSSNLSVICSSQKFAEDRISINIPQDKAIDATNDKPLDKDEKEKHPISNLVQELNEHPIGRVTPTAPRTTSHRNRFTSISRAFGDGSKLLPEDHMLTGFASGSKKPRSQVSYSGSPRSEELGLKNKDHFRKIQSHVSVKTSDAKKLPDSSRSGHSSPELLTCIANVLVTVGDRGWREYDTQITMDSDVHSEQRICVKLAEGTKYAHKVCQVLQPGATNRYTHAMMWKGGAEWCLEFPDRSQWLIFKQMHDECYSHNIRAASVRNIPTPGVHLVGIHDDNDMVSFVRSEDYLVHIGTDVEIALDEARVLYNMDSDDEEWISSRQKFLVRDNNATLELAEDLFERVMDKLEKFAYSHDSNELSIVQMKELETDDLPLDIIEVIHAYWQAKRQKKGMPLIRHFQFAMWKVYEQQLHEWESKVCRMQGSSNGYQGKKMPPKPALFAFCLRPRGLDVPYKGPKQRSHKKLMSTGCHSFSRQHDGFYRQAGYSPRFSTRTGSLRAFESSESSTPRFFRTNIVKRSATVAFSDDHQPSPSFRPQRVKRSASDHWNTVIHDWQNSKHLFPGSPPVDIEELKLRDAASAAQHAAAMAKLKREKAHCLMQKADLALHKATVALMIADAIKSSSRNKSRDCRRGFDE